jgi:hypothetical protein
MWRGATAWPAFGTGASMIMAGETAAKLVIYLIAQGSHPGTRLTNWFVCVHTGHAGEPPPRRQDWSRRADRDELARHLRRYRVPGVDHPALVAATATCSTSRCATATRCRTGRGAGSRCSATRRTRCPDGLERCRAPHPLTTHTSG